MNRTISTCRAVLFILFLLAPTRLTVSAKAISNTIYVPTDYPTIQEAINHANQGDTIYVYNGTYHENVLLNKTLSLVGENESTTIIDGSGIGNVVKVTSNNVNVTGFSLQNGRREWGFYGILLYNCTDNRIINNIVRNNQEGIRIAYGSNNTLIENAVEDNSGGIRLDTSSYNLLQNNTLARNKRNFGVWGDRTSHFTHVIDESNTVNGKPICYWIDRQDAEVPMDAGYLALVSSKNITAKGLVLENNWDGIVFFNTTESSIESSQIRNNSVGVRINWPSSNNMIAQNNITDNEWDGIWLFGSSNTTITLNTIVNNSNGGIFARDDYINHADSLNNTITANTCDSIVLWPSDNNTISSNKMSSSKSALTLTESSGNTITSNSIIATLGCIELSWSYNNSIMNNIVEGGRNGILLYRCSANNVCDNIARKNGVGIPVDKSDNNSIYQNDIINNEFGINIQTSFNNTIFHNNFLDNTLQVFTYMAINFWDNGYPSGGNYWSDYNGTDMYGGPYQNETGCDWLGDTPYAISGGYYSNKDDYPLMYPFTPETEEIETRLRIALRNISRMYTNMQLEFEILNSTYFQLLDDYNKLLADFSSLNADYRQHLIEYTWLQGNYTSLRDSYNSLIVDFGRFKEQTQDELSVTRNLTYVSLALILILMLTTTYFAKKKPKIETATKTEMTKEKERGPETPPETH